MPEIAAVVREALRADFIGTGQHRGRKKKRIISAGALHPVKCAIIGASGNVVIYDDDLDIFSSAEPRDADRLKAFNKKCADVLPFAQCHVLALMADSGTLSTVYSNAQSLMWRDAGAVLQILALVSEVFNLGFCPLGILGQEVADALLPDGHRFIGVGVAAVGRHLCE
ncbi:hypothetical protein [Rhizobium sp. PP-CC-3G-465]|uniref:hypothetical protein n=1 Tax=Rhizobium sp. PP-CC-3G-465 TaxID=2135648 RepID=UPI0010488DEA|nr:hypothetical protein C8J33_1036 [Rhizobium sp. PP-CC-3G-465]